MIVVIKYKLDLNVADHYYFLISKVIFKKMVKNNTKKRKKFSIEKFSDYPLSKKYEIWITTIICYELHAQTLYYKTP